MCHRQTTHTFPLNPTEAELLRHLCLWVRWNTPGALSVGNRNVHDIFKFRVCGGWNEPLAFPFLSSCFSFSLFSLLPLWICDSDIVQSDFKLCHFLVAVLCLFLDFHLVPGSRSGGISFCWTTLTVPNLSAWATSVWQSWTTFWNDALDLFCKH